MADKKEHPRHQEAERVQGDQPRAALAPEAEQPGGAPPKNDPDKAAPQAHPGGDPAAPPIQANDPNLVRPDQKRVPELEEYERRRQHTAPVHTAGPGGTPLPNVQGVGAPSVMAAPMQSDIAEVPGRLRRIGAALTKRDQPPLTAIHDTLYVTHWAVTAFVGQDPGFPTPSNQAAQAPRPVKAERPKPSDRERVIDAEDSELAEQLNGLAVQLEERRNAPAGAQAAWSIPAWLLPVLQEALLRFLGSLSGG